MPCAKGLFSDTAGGVEGGREEMRLSTGTREDPWASEASTGLPGSTGTFCSRRSHQLSLPISLCEEPWEHGDRETDTHTPRHVWSLRGAFAPSLHLSICCAVPRLPDPSR